MGYRHNIRSQITSDTLPGSVAVMLLLTVGYYLMARFGLPMVFLQKSVSMVWGATGISLAALLIFRPRIWPGIAVGIFLANVAAEAPFTFDLLAAGSSTAASLTGFYFLRRVFHFDTALERISDAASLIAGGAVISATVSATLGTLAMSINDSLAGLNVGSVWGTWWLGEATGILVFTPLLLRWKHPPLLRWPSRQRVEIVLLLCLLTLISAFVFNNAWTTARDYPLVYLGFPIMILIALRFSGREVATGSLLLSVLAVYGVTQGIGPFIRETTEASLLLLWSYVAVVSITGLLMAATLAERKQAAQELARERDFALTVMNALGQGVMVTEFDGPAASDLRIKYANPAYAKIIGYSSEEIIGRAPEYFTLPEDIPILRQARALRKQGESSIYETRARHHDGHSVNLLVTGVPWYQDGKLAGAVTVISDLTEQKKVEQELQYQRDFALTVMNTLGQGVSVTRSDGAFEYVNPAFARMLGYEPDEIVGRAPAEFTVKEDQGTLAAAFESRRAGLASTYELRLLHRSGDVIDVLVTGTPRWQAGQDQGSVAVVTNVTDRKTSEKALLRSEERYRSLVDLSPDGVFLSYFKSQQANLEIATIDYANHALARILGAPSPSALIGRRLIEFIHPDYAAAAAERAQSIVEQKQITQPMHQKYLRLDGATIDVEISAAPVELDGMSAAQVIVRDITERIQLQNTVRETEARSQALLNAIPDAMFILSHNGTYVDYHAPVTHKISRSAEALLGKNLLSLLPDYLQETVQILFKKVSATGEAQIFEYPITVGSEDEYFEARLVPYVQDKLLIIIRDITERTKVEQILQEMTASAILFQERLLALHEVSVELTKAETFDNLCRQAVELGRSQLGFDRLGIWFFDADDPQLMVGSYGTSLDGQTVDERARRHPINDAPRVMEAVARSQPVHSCDAVRVATDADGNARYGWNAIALMREGDHRIGLISADNALRQHSSSDAATNHDLEILMLYASTLSILFQRKQADELLRKGEARLRSIFMGASMGIVVANTNGYPLSANPAFERMMGYSEAELQRLPFRSFTHPADTASNLELFRDLVNRQIEHYQLEKRYIRKNGESFWVRMNVSLFPTTVGDETLVLALVEDISEHLEAQQRALDLAVERERIQILSHFITDASHEFRTPLAIINTNLYLSQRTEDLVKRQEFTNGIQQQVAQIASLVDALVHMARLDAGVIRGYKPINLAEALRIIRDKLSSGIHEKNLTLHTEIDSGVATVFGEVDEIFSALANLIDNAVRYSHANGIIHIRVRHHDPLRTRIEVEDAGIGIDEQDLPHIFDSFFRVDKSRSTRGFGLGLAITRKIIERHGGSISAESEPGAGTRFTLLLPYNADKSPYAEIKTG